MGHRVYSAGVALAAALLGALPAAAQRPATFEDILDKCGGPDNPQPPGPKWEDYVYPGNHAEAVTPTTFPGAFVVGAADANCLVTNFPGRILVLSGARYDDYEYLLPGAMRWDWAAGRDTEAWPVKPADARPEFTRLLGELTGGNKEYPLLIYGHDEKDSGVLMLIARALEAGYELVFWNRPGRIGWVKAGYDYRREPSAFEVALRRAEEAWKKCAENAKFDSSGAEAEALNRVMVECSAETQAMRSASAKFSPAAVSVTDEHIITKSLFSTIFDIRQNSDREAKRLGDQGIGIPVAEQMRGWEFCWYNMKHENVTYVQVPRPASVRRMSDTALEAYNRENQLRATKRLMDFLRTLEGRAGPLTKSNLLHDGACWFSKTQAEALAISADPARFAAPSRPHLASIGKVFDPGF